MAADDTPTVVVASAAVVVSSPLAVVSAAVVVSSPLAVVSAASVVLPGLPLLSNGGAAPFERLRRQRNNARHLIIMEV